MSLDSAVEGTILLESQYVCIPCLTYFGPVTGSSSSSIGSGSDNSYDNNDDDNRSDNIHSSRTGSNGESGTNPYLEALLNSSDPPLEHPYYLADSVACTDLDFDCIIDFEKHIMHYRELRTLYIDYKEIQFFQDLRKTRLLASVCRLYRNIRDPPKKRIDGMPKLISATNNIDPSPDYIHQNLLTLSKIEALLIARVYCSVQVWSLRGISQKSKAYCIHFPREVDNVFISVPLYTTDIEILVLKPTQDDPNATTVFEKQFRVRRNVVAIQCKHLLALHPGYRSIVLFNKAALSALLVDSSILDQLPNTRYESTFDGYTTIDQLVEAANKGNKYVSVPNIQVTQTAVKELRKRVGSARTASITWLRRRNQPLSEYDRTLSLISCTLPKLFPVSAAEPNMACIRHISFYNWFEHILKYCDNRFAQHYSFRFIGLNISIRIKARATSTYFVRQHPDHAAITTDELRAAFVVQGNTRADALLYLITRQGAGLQGTRAYQGPQKTNVTTYVRAFGPPGGFFTFSTADLYWLSLIQYMLQYDEQLTVYKDEKMRITRRNLRDNPYIANYHLARRVDLFCKHVLFKKFNITDQQYRFEQQGRSSAYVYSFFWSTGLPKQDLATSQGRGEFARLYSAYITTMNPDPGRLRTDVDKDSVLRLTSPTLNNSQEQLSDIVNRVLHYVHGFACLRHRKGTPTGTTECRYKFPRNERSKAVVDYTRNPNYLGFEPAYNDSWLNSYCRVIIYGQRTNCDIIPYTTVEQVIAYLAKYTAKAKIPT